MAPKIALYVESGLQAGRKFIVGEGDICLGRSSECEISAQDPALSRKHCLFEERDGVLYVTDLSSANGTFVNGEQIPDVEDVPLKTGDVIEAGGTCIRVVLDGPAKEVEVLDLSGSASGGDAPSEGFSVKAEDKPAPQGDAVNIDLGFNKDTAGESALEAGNVKSGSKFGMFRFVCAAFVLAAIVLGVFEYFSKDIAGLFGLAPDESVKRFSGGGVSNGHFVSLQYERVDATENGIYRCAITIDSSGMFRTVIDDVPANRHADESKKLEKKEVEALLKRLQLEQLRKADRLAVDIARPNELHSLTLQLAWTDEIRTYCVENAAIPEEFDVTRNVLEAFAQSEFSLGAMEQTAEQLIAASDDAERLGDSKWDERDNGLDNLVKSLRSYEEAIELLKTVSPKPPMYSRIVDKKARTLREYERRYKMKRADCDLAFNQKNWESASRAFGELRDMIDKQDSRYNEITAKLNEVQRKSAERKGAK